MLSNSGETSTVLWKISPKASLEIVEKKDETKICAPFSAEHGR